MGLTHGGESSKVARSMESAHRTALAKGERGIRNKMALPILAEFLERYFLPSIEVHFTNKPNTRE